MISLMVGMLWCGVTGLVCSLAAYADYRAVEYGKAARKRNAACCCALTGVAVFMLLVAGALVALMVYPDEARDFICDKLDFFKCK